MGAIREILVPDVGDFERVDVAEVLVSSGDQVEVDDPIVTLESDKASLEIPSDRPGTIREVLVSVGDQVALGTLIARLEESETVPQDEPTEPSEADLLEAERTPIGSPEENELAHPEPEKKPPEAPAKSPGPSVIDVVVPDLGDFDEVEVAEVLVSAGDSISAEDPLITLESDKASMEVPAVQTGVVQDVKLRVGDKVSPGTSILSLKVSGVVRGPTATPTGSSEKASGADETPPAAKPLAPPTAEAPARREDTRPHASPSVRRFARQLGADLGSVSGSGRRGRILRGDVEAFVKARLDRTADGDGVGLPQIPAVDFSRFGETETKPLSRIRKLSGAHVHRSWVNLPHVTQFDEADITEMEAFRKAHADEAQARGVKLTPVAFLIKASVAALKAFPEFNSSLSENGSSLILKKYFNIGVAVDTPNGLIVPVIRDADSKGLFRLAEELGEVSARAREGRISPTDLQGGCFSISSLGGIGGTGFTPIINAPEVAILGISRSALKPVYKSGAFAPRLILPFSLSYDHRVIDGASAVRFTSYLSGVLTDVRKLIL